MGLTREQELWRDWLASENESSRIKDYICWQLGNMANHRSYDDPAGYLVLREDVNMAIGRLAASQAKSIDLSDQFNKESGICARSRCTGRSLSTRSVTDTGEPGHFATYAPTSLDEQWSHTGSTSRKLVESTLSSALSATTRKTSSAWSTTTTTDRRT